MNSSHKTRDSSPVELLAPGGDSDCVKAAILAGADAVYCGLSSFNARRRAENISLEALKDLVIIAHNHSCRIYLTLNTLIMEHEFPELVALLKQISAIGVDAVIVQDYGLLAMLHEYFPALEVHASTQMTAHNRGNYAFLAALGVTRINLARELSLDEIRELSAYGHALNIQTEVFVHGAYCISFSGQCYMSSVLCGHSGNRGDCVQPCRRTYFASPHTGSGPGAGFLPFNLKDNSAFSSAAALIHAGADSFKIEGRIKSFRYVYTTVRAWRRQLDTFCATGQTRKNDPALSTVFNRQFSDGYLTGHISSLMFIDTSRDQSLVPMAKILSYSADTKILKLDCAVTVSPDTPVLIYTPDFTFICTGFLEKKVGGRDYRFRIEHKLKGKISRGCILYKQNSSSGSAVLKERIDRLQAEKAVVSIILTGAQGTPLQAQFVTAEKCATVMTGAVLAPAVSQSLSRQVITEKLGKLGTTAFQLGNIDFSGLADNLFIPARELNELRRKGVEALTGRECSLDEMPALSRPNEKKRGQIMSSLACLVADEADLLLCSGSTATFLFEIPVNPGREGKNLIDLFNRHKELVPWFPAILIGKDFDAAEAFLKNIAPPVIITDNSGIASLAAQNGVPWIAGPLFNSTNSYALQALKKYGACSGAFISPELSRSRIQAIKAPEAFDLWYTLFNPLLLLNTRQCLVRNCPGCTKEDMNSDCIASCSRSATVYDTNNNPFFITKRAGFYSQVYNGRHFLNIDILRDIKGLFSFFVIDLRDIRTQTSLHAPKDVLLKTFQACLLNRAGSANAVTAQIRTTTAGQYLRELD
ncbi:MAG: U32 family peptidase [Pseudomonadota bacterium]